MKIKKHTKKKTISKKIEGRTKVIRINGVKTTIILPPRLRSREIPIKIYSERNHPRGLVLNL